MCLAQGHNGVMPVRHEPAALPSSTLPLRSLFTEVIKNEISCTGPCMYIVFNMSMHPLLYSTGMCMSYEDYMYLCGFTGLSEPSLVIRGSRKYCQRVSNFDNLFFIFHFQIFMVKRPRGREGPNTIISRGLHRPARETPFQWRFAGVPMMAQH